jgi:hypothetical protein
VEAPAITRRDLRIILICNQGYQSTLAAAAGADRFSGGPGVDTATDLNPAQGDTRDGTIP